MGRFKQGLRHFMMGRYGTDKLNMVMLGAGVLVSIVGMFLPFPMVKLILMLVSYVLMFWALFRCFYRNTYKRYQENRKFLMLWDRVKDRQHKYFTCPRCKQTVRVPKGKGKIAIKCPKCGEKFIKKS